MRQRQLLAAGCAHGAALWGGTAFAAEGGGAVAPAVAASVPAFDDDYAMPRRFQRPDLASDEGGPWALMDGQEAKLRHSSFMMHDAALHDYLQGIACRLAGEHAPDVRVYPMHTPFFNASMAPNGMMQVWSESTRSVAWPRRCRPAGRWAKPNSCARWRRCRRC